MTSFFLIRHIFEDSCFPRGLFKVARSLTRRDLCHGADGSCRKNEAWRFTRHIGAPILTLSRMLLEIQGVVCHHDFKDLGFKFGRRRFVGRSTTRAGRGRSVRQSRSMILAGFCCVCRLQSKCTRWFDRIGGRWWRFVRWRCGGFRFCDGIRYHRLITGAVLAKPVCIVYQGLTAESTVESRQLFTPFSYVL